eukprot:CAMPEP_0171189406 /NCGR_PEP_ID=MMETSP0790-20130122/18330_1 /TAXON_ID=2925 /ORGANISM="Alexandrium catenella, Strain OF101" /LENGTH=205 /DNA_ID=CAMNT_0011654517 /DNA_START=90 /DNA_END=704 /DNA_ORIENTATION=+
MGKSIRAKIKKRFRTAKRQRVDAMIITPREIAHNEALTRVIEGRSVTFATPRNAFKYPEDPTATFPQHEVVKPIDFRSSHLPMASYAFRGNRRKYEGEQKTYMASLAKSSHPEMEVLAGGGAVLSSGKHVSLHEAEILATAARDPEAAAKAVATPASASDAEAAVAEAAGGDVEMAGRVGASAAAAADAAAGPTSKQEDEEGEEP